MIGSAAHNRIEEFSAVSYSNVEILFESGENKEDVINARIKFLSRRKIRVCSGIIISSEEIGERHNYILVKAAVALRGCTTAALRRKNRVRERGITQASFVRVIGSCEKNAKRFAERVPVRTKEPCFVLSETLRERDTGELLVI